MLIIDKVKETGVQLLDPRNGYDLIAPYYEEWHWFRFWRQNEAPIIEQWLGDLKPGFGLDAGSGTGPYIHRITQFGHRCVAFDLSWQMLSINREKEIPMNGTKLGIKTYKHPIGDFRRAVSSLQGFQLLDLDEYYLKDLCWQPPEANFSKLYCHSNPAVFYVSRLKKQI
jgi:SAM-dependent methyltransferase